jgi:hypothetical protein
MGYSMIKWGGVVDEEEGRDVERDEVNDKENRRRLRPVKEMKWKGRQDSDV